ncbi:MAG: hypothetical protein ABFD49_03835 [Armatimonadota bacterium]|nr:hypothetical protein [bacterium]
MSSISATGANTLIQSYYTSSTGSTSDSTDTNSALESVYSSSDISDSLEISTSGAIYSSLSDLSKSNNDEFKSVCTKIASGLSSYAKSSGNRNLLTLANKFAEAAESGDISDLESTSNDNSTTNYSLRTTLNDSIVSVLLSTGSDDSSSGAANLLETLYNTASSAYSMASATYMSTDDTSETST